MADEPVIDTKSSEPTPTADVATPPTPAPADGDADAGDADTSLLGAAKADTGDGGDGKVGDADSGKDGGDGDGKTAAADVPETYELAAVKITGEDGTETEVPIDTALLEEATPVFKAAGLTKDQAQTLAPLALKVQERVVSQQADDFAAMRADWAKQAKADKEIGGSNWKETETLAARALDTFGATEGSEFRKLLNESGFGDHPEMIRMFRKIGEKLGEDPLTPSSHGATPERKPRENILYPDDVPKEGAK